MKEQVSFLRITDVSLRYPGKVQALESVNAFMEKGEILSVIGNSGGGKSTLLRLIAGFEKPDSGEIRMEGVLLSSQSTILPPAQRGVGMIFQDYALFPHMTVKQNVNYGYRLDLLKGESAETIMELCGVDHLQKRYPHELSGGQQQKVALARALAASPKLLLMDEPFSSIDILHKASLRNELKALFAARGLTAVIVSHDYEDVLSLADKVLVLEDGKEQQFGQIVEIYRRPANAYVARLFGECNVLKGEMTDGSLKTAFGQIPVQNTMHIVGNQLFLRPSSLRISSSEGPLKGTVSAKYFAGDRMRYELTSGKERLMVDSDLSDIPVGAEVRVVIV